MSAWAALALILNLTLAVLAVASFVSLWHNDALKTPTQVETTSARFTPADSPAAP